MTSPHERPAAVTNAVGLYYVSLALGIIRLMVVWREMSGELATTLAVLIVGIPYAVLLVVLQFVNRGHNWARITLAMLFVLTTPLPTASMLESLGTQPLIAILRILQLALQVGALVMLFGAQARPWFDSTERNATLAAEMKRCPYCAESIRREAIKCRFCGSAIAAA